MISSLGEVCFSSLCAPADSGTAPLSLRISVTDRCQLRCRYCMPPGGIQLVPRQQILSYDEILRFVVAVQRGAGLEKIRITGGEPLLRPGLTSFIASLADRGVHDIALTTNGQLLAEKAFALKAAGLKRVNVSLDSLDLKSFRQSACSGSPEAAIAGIDAARAAGLGPVKINMVVLRGINDAEVIAMARFALDRKCEMRFLELMPIGPSASQFTSWYVSSDEVRSRLEEAFVLESVAWDGRNSSRRFRVRDRNGRDGTIGFISSHSHPFCAGCNRLRLTATGRILGCLGREEGIEVRPLLQLQEDNHAVVEAVETVMAFKARRHDFASQGVLAQIGG